MSRTVWAGECRSWYTNHSTDPHALTLWPGSSLHYIAAISEVHYDDWEIVYKGNRFAWPGNGFSQTELDPTCICDWAYYLNDSDDSPYLSKARKRETETANGSRDPASPIAKFGQSTQ